MNRRVLGLLCLLTGAYFVLFYHLGTRPLHVWDESRSAQNALEMSRSGDLLVTRFAGQPDHWNTKPPLQIWLQAGLLKAGLRPETAIRLPSALAALCAMLLLMGYCAKRLDDGDRIGLFSALVLLSSFGYVGVHVGRTGDFDALLSLFVLIYGLAFFEIVESEGRPSSLTIAIFFTSAVCAVLTKSIAGCLALPALAIYLVARRRTRTTLTDWRFLLGAALATTVVVGYVLLRQRADPGYLHAVLFYDLKRVSVQIGKFHYGPTFYFRGFMTRRFLPWIFLLAIAFIIGVRQPSARTARLTWFSGLVAMFVLAVISTSETKHAWYDAQTYPFMALVIGIGLASVIRELAGYREIARDGRPGQLDRRLLEAGVIAMFALPVGYVMSQTRDNYWYAGGAEPQEQYGTFLRELRQRGIDDIDVSDTGIWAESGENHYVEPLLFYTEYENARGARIHIDTLQVYRDGHDVASCDPVVVRALRARPATVVLEQGACALLRLPAANHTQ